MSKASRQLALCLLVGTSACASQPAPEARVPTPPTPVVAVERPAEVPVARPAVDVSIEVTDRFVSLALAAIDSHLPQPAWVAGQLGAVHGPAFETVAGAPARLDKLRAEAEGARGEVYACEALRAQAEENGEPPEGACHDLDAREAEAERRGNAADAAQDQQSDALTKLRDAIDQDYQQQQSAPLALALALLDQMALALGGESAPSASLGEYGNVRARDGAQPDESLLESAASLAPARDPVGAWARYLLVAALWGEDRDKVLSYLDELLPTPAPEIAPFVDELRYRRAMLLADGVQADHQAALAALDAIDPDDRHGDIGRDDVILGRLMAAYRSGDLPRTVSLASEAYRPREATVGADHAARRAADLRIAFGGVLPPYAPATALDKISSHGVERIVADCVERLGIERAGLDRAPPLLYAAVTVRLTLRALHRGDRQAARDYLALAQARVREQAPLRATVDELASLLRGGELDEPAREALRGKLKSFGAVDPMTAGVLAALGSPTPPSIEEQEVDEVLDPDDEPTAERRFAALVRLCLEPAHWRVDTSDETRLEVVLSVYQRHPPEVKMQTNGLVADELESCMQQQVASLYAQSPSSVHASIDLSGVHDRPEAPAPYGIMGVMSGGGLGDAGLGDIGAIGGLGSGGLGLRGTGLGGGGSGGSVGIGTIGTIGRGGGGRIAVGGAGAASARVSGPPPAKAPSAKAPGKGTGTPKKPKPASGPPPRAGK